jgi:four helix bundle protein
MKHKGLLAWQRAHLVAGGVFDLCSEYWKPQAAAAFNQVQKASLSVQLNIAEGYALRSDGAFGRHLTIAYGSAVETSDVLEFLDEKAVVPPEIIKPLMLRSRERQALVLALLRRVRRASRVERRA